MLVQGQITEKTDGNRPSITFIKTYNPNHNINLKKFHSCLDDIKNKELKTYFQQKNVVLSTRQPSNLRKLFATAKFERSPIPKWIKQVGFLPCANCICHRNIYFKECFYCSFKSKRKLLAWHYKRFLSFDSKIVLYVFFCKNCYFFCIGQTEELKQWTRKHKPDVIYSNTLFCMKKINTFANLKKDAISWTGSHN